MRASNCTSCQFECISRFSTVNIALTAFMFCNWPIDKLRAHDKMKLSGSGSAVALYHLVEAQIEHAPVVLGVTALLALANDRYKIRQCGYR